MQVPSTLLSKIVASIVVPLELLLRYEAIRAHIPLKGGLNDMQFNETGVILLYTKQEWSVKDNRDGVYNETKYVRIALLTENAIQWTW